MKTSFSEFLHHYPRYGKLKLSSHAKHIFEKILSRDEAIIGMIHYSEMNKPALSACIQEVEAYCLTIISDQFNIQKTFYRQAIGSMVGSILYPFGYIKYGEKRLSQHHQGMIISASTYKQHHNGILKVVSQIILNLSKATLEDFCDQYPLYQGFQERLDIRFIFDHILSRDHTMIAMIQACHLGKSALSVCLEELESYYHVHRSSTYLDLTIDEHQKAIEAMISCILTPLGYQRNHTVPLPHHLQSYFKIAYTYTKN